MCPIGKYKFYWFSKFLSDGKVAAIKKCAAARLLIQLATNVTTVKTGKGQKQNNPKVFLKGLPIYIFWRMSINVNTNLWFSHIRLSDSWIAFAWESSLMIGFSLYWNFVTLKTNFLQLVYLEKAAQKNLGGLCLDRSCQKHTLHSRFESKLEPWQT